MRKQTVLLITIFSIFVFLINTNVTSASVIVTGTGQNLENAIDGDENTYALLEPGKNLNIDYGRQIENDVLFVYEKVGGTQLASISARFYDENGDFTSAFYFMEGERDVIETYRISDVPIGSTQIRIQLSPAAMVDYRIYEVYEGVESQDISSPAAPTGLTAITGDNVVILEWNANIEEDISYYNVYRDNILIASNITDTNYEDTDVINGVTYTYEIAAVDNAGNESEKSLPVTATPNVIKNELMVNLIGNKDSIVVQISGGTPPYYIDWGLGNELINASQYVITGLTPDTDYTVTVIDSESEEYTETINTGNKKAYVPPVMPSPVAAFQKMLDSFGSAGIIGISIVAASVSLGVMVILALWGWRMAKRWLSTTR